MIKKVVLVSTLFLLACSSSKQAVSTKPAPAICEGFQWIKWGMTREQVVKAAPPEILKQNNSGYDPEDINSVPLTDYCKGQLYILYDRKGECYSVEVMLESQVAPLEGEDVTIKTYRHLQSALVKKYGIPTYTRQPERTYDTDDKLLHSGELPWADKWDLGESKITLVWKSGSPLYVIYTDVPRSKQEDAQDKKEKQEKENLILGDQKKNGL
jgi:hypothetical protein